ncbi:MAG: DUF2322 family protein [Formosimonas sp.]
MLFQTSTVFKDNLAQFPSIDGVERIEFYQDDQLLSSINNVEGQKGSLALYYYLFKTMGTLDLAAARRGLELYAEHTADARANVGKHPNVDRLILVEATNKAMSMKVVYAQGHTPSNGWDDEEKDTGNA